MVGTVYPELAEEINAKIDEGVRIAHEAVDSVAEGLKAVVSFIVDKLAQALDAILSFVQGALNTIIAVVSAAISGDWDEVLRLILDPILGVLGIAPDDFYNYIGNALATLGNILDHPLDFLTNLFNAVVGGFQKFADNIVDHLIGGIIGWLTGAFAGDIQMPEKLDFWGVMDIIRQILGLTMAMMRRIAVRILGESAVQKIEFFIGYATTLITGGWGAFFDQIQEDLTGLADTVMSSITKFLVERVVKAGVVWLASLINPAGALLKIIMMVWDFIMWMKDNFMRFVRIIQTIVEGMINIANGVIEPASDAIERVLAGLLAPAIDLVARLLGLGRVSEKVKDIIGGVRQKIEDAVVKLINKVIARFTRRGNDQTNPNAPDAEGDLMQPVPFSGGGENHTLYVRKDGDNVIPMMRSQPVAVQNWLEALKQKSGVRTQLEAGSIENVTDTLVDTKHAEIQPLVTTALREEEEMDQSGDQAEAANDRDPETSDDEKQELSQSAREAAEALSNILEKLGLSEARNFEEVFADQIGTDGNVRDSIRTTLGGTVASRINNDLPKKIIYSQLRWEEIKTQLLSDRDVLTNSLSRPLHSGGKLRLDTEFMTTFFNTAGEIAVDEKDELGLEDPNTLLNSAEKKAAF